MHTNGEQILPKAARSAFRRQHITIKRNEKTRATREKSHTKTAETNKRVWSGASWFCKMFATMCAQQCCSNGQNNGCYMGAQTTYKCVVLSVFVCVCVCVWCICVNCLNSTHMCFLDVLLLFERILTLLPSHEDG